MPGNIGRLGLTREKDIYINLENDVYWPVIAGQERCTRNQRA